MKIKSAQIEISGNEYVVDSDDFNASNYEIYLNGKKLNDVIGLIRVGGL